MEPLDDHFASIQNTILTSTQLIAASIRSCAATRAEMRAHQFDMARMRASMAAIRDPFEAGWK